jgi:hypothetical protein
MTMYEEQIADIQDALTSAARMLEDLHDELGGERLEPAIRRALTKVDDAIAILEEVQS